MNDFSKNIANVFLRPDEKEMIESAIKEAEEKTSAEIVVSIVGKIVDGGGRIGRYLSRNSVESKVRNFAVKHFMDLGIQQTEGRTGILILVAVQEARVEIIADKAINDKYDESLLPKCVECIIEASAKGDPVRGLLVTINRLRDILSKDFPRTENDVNEVSNAVQSS